MIFTLTKQKLKEFLSVEGPDTIEVTLDQLKEKDFNIKGYELPNDIAPFLTGKAKETWESGWRGYLRYFCK